MDSATADWKTEARSLRDQGLSEREIGEAVGKSRSTVHDALKGYEVTTSANGSGNGTVDPAALAGAAGITADQEAARTPTQRLDEQADRGEAVGPLQPAPGQRTLDGQEVQRPIEELRVDGTAQLGMFDAGGKKPQSASLRLTGGKVLLVDGRAFRKGDVIRFSGTAVVEEVAQRDKPDPKTGIVVSAEQKHLARITDLRVDA